MLVLNSEEEKHQLLSERNVQEQMPSNKYLLYID